MATVVNIAEIVKTAIIVEIAEMVKTSENDKTSKIAIAKVLDQSSRNIENSQRDWRSQNRQNC